MLLLDTMMAKLARVKKMFANKQVGICPSDYGRFDQALASILDGMDITGILLPSPQTCDQGFVPFHDRDLFLASIETCLCWGKDTDYYELRLYAIERGYTVRFINMLCPDEPLGLLRAEREPAYYHVPADPLDDDGLAVLTGMTAEYLRPFSEFEQDIISNIHNWVHDTPYQTGIVRDGAVPFVCPYCGKKLASSHSLVISSKEAGHSVFHPFSCCREFFLVAKPYGFNYPALYLPAEEQVILLSGVHGKTVYPLEKKIFKAIEQLKMLVFMYRDQIQEYLATPTDGVTGVVGVTGNVGHYLISEANAAYRYREKYNEPQECLSTNLKVHGVMQGFFDEDMLGLAMAQDIKRTTTNIFLEPIKKNRLAFFPYTWAPLAQGPRRRLLDKARKRCNVAVDKNMQQAQSCSPLIMVTLRPSTRRIWMGQDDDIPWILNQLHEKHPKLGVVFDGIPKEGPFSLKDNLNKVISNLNEGISTFEAVGCSLDETLAWADISSLYLGPSGAGSGLTIPADLTVICFGPFQSFGKVTWEGEGRILATGIDMDHQPIIVIPADNERVQQGDILYDVNRDQILESMEEQLNRILANQ